MARSFAEFARRTPSIARARPPSNEAATTFGKNRPRLRSHRPHAPIHFRLAEPDDALATCQIYDANMMVAPDDSLNPMPALGLAICGDYREAIFGNAIRVR